MKKIISLLLLCCYLPIHAQKSLTILEDGQLTSKYYFNPSNLLTKEVVYNTENKKSDTIHYTYKTGVLKNIVISGKGDVIGVDKEWLLKSFLDLRYQIEFLAQYNIMVPEAQVNGGSVSDISHIFSVTDRFTEKQEGSQRIISFDSLNANIRFYPSAIETFIPQNTTINRYELILDHNLVQHETYVTDSIVLYRNYRYQNNKLSSIVSEAKYPDHEEFSSVKTFTWSDF